MLAAVIALAVTVTARPQKRKPAEVEQAQNKEAVMTQTKNMTPEQRAQAQTDRLQSKLNLSAEQTKKVYDINLKYVNKRAELRENPDHKQMVETMKAQQKEIKSVLTPEQQEAYKVLTDKAKAAKGGSGHKGKGPRPEDKK